MHLRSTTVIVEEPSDDIAKLISIVAAICGVLVIITISVVLLIFTILKKCENKKGESIL